MAGKKRIDLYKIIIVGVGGTGSELCNTVAKYVYDKQKDESTRWVIELIDGDTVSPSNIGRQSFLSCDIGLLKTDVLSMAIDECLPETTTNKKVEVHSVAKYIDEPGDFMRGIWDMGNISSWLYDCHYHLIIFGCVDNHRARQTLHTVFNSIDVKKGCDVLYIDSANEFDYGSVVSAYKNARGIISPSRAWYYPDVLTSTERKASEISCGEVNVSAPQHYKTNKQAANICFQLLTNFVEDKEVFKGQIFFNTKLMSVQTRPLEFYIGNLLEKYKVKTFYGLNNKLNKLKEAKEHEECEEEKVS